LHQKSFASLACKEAKKNPAKQPGQKEDVVS
jgi:hypothetical protein